MHLKGGGVRKDVASQIEIKTFPGHIFQGVSGKRVVFAFVCQNLSLL